MRLSIINKTPVLGSEDGRTRGTTSVAHRRRGPLSQRDQCVADPAGLPRYRADPGAPTRTLAVRAPAQGRYPRESGDPASIVPGLLFADWLGLVPVIAYDENGTDVAPRGPTVRNRQAWREPELSRRRFSQRVFTRR